MREDERSQPLEAAEAEGVLAELANVFFPSGAPSPRADADPPDAETRYQVLLEQMPAVVFMVYLDRGIGDAYVSPQIENMLGFTRQEWLEEPIRWYRQVHPLDKERWSVEAAQFFLTGEPLRSIYRVIARDGHVVWFQCEAKMVRREDGRPWFIHGVGFNVTELKQTEESLEKALFAAQAGNRARSEFLANMSHEIRTPINGIMGMTQLALLTDLTPEQREYLLTASASAASLLSIVNGILDFSSAESRKLVLEITDFNPRRCVEEVVESMAPRAREKNLALACRILPGVPETVRGDPLRLRQVIASLVDNAVKFTERGEIMLRVETETKTANEVRLRFQVADTGIGIPGEKKALIFEPFSQVDGSSTRRYGGAGLGLTVSSELVKLMGGQILVESEPGRGSAFHFTATFSLPADGALQPKSPRRLQVLLVEDNPINQRLIVRLLEKQGHRVSVAGNGTEALRAIEKQLFDLALMDIQMPEMDGFDAAAAIREREKLTGGRLPIIAVTAHTLNGERDKCLAAGMDGYVSKPINARVLLDAMEAAAT